MRIGIVMSRAPVDVKFNTDERFPSWNTHTRAPKVAESDRRLSTTALSGTTSEPNIRNSNTNVVTAMMPSAQGRDPMREAFESTSSAAPPCTRTANGASASRMSPINASPSSDDGDTSAMTDRYVPVSSGEAKRRELSPGDATRAPAACEPAMESTRATCSIADSRAA